MLKSNDKSALIMLTLEWFKNHSGCHCSNRIPGI